MAKVIRKLREHWKKSTFAAIAGYYGIDYAYDRHQTFLMMREYSKQALVHGKRRLPPGAKNKHVTLLLNPTAGNRKAKAKLEKYGEPLLHLSGFLVNTVKTERIDEARDLANLIEKTNIIAIAGGDGTLFETVTGLLRRADADEAVCRYQIGIIPIGSENQLAKRLIDQSMQTREEMFIAESAMAIVNHKIKPVDVMEIKIAEEVKTSEEEAPSNEKKKKPFYSLVGLEMGQYREAKKLKKEMFSIFGQFLNTFWSLYRVQPLSIKAELNYIPVCLGCGKCKMEQEKQAELKKQQEKETRVAQKSSSPGFWGRIFSTFGSPVLADTVKETEVIDETVNPDCGVVKSINVDTSELNINVSGDGKLTVQVGNKMDRTDFMIEGLKRLRGESSNYSNVFECKEIELCPLECPEFFSIDNEEFEVKRIRLKSIKNRVNFFVS